MWLFRRSAIRTYEPPPELPEAVAARQTLSSVPGPSPWYLIGHPDAPRLHNAHGPLDWQAASESAEHSGKTVLHAVDGTVLAVCDFYCYVASLDGRRFIVWSKEELGKGVISEHRVRIQLFDSYYLESIDLHSAVSKLSSSRRFFTAAAELATVGIPTSLSDGEHRCELPLCVATRRLMRLRRWQSTWCRLNLISRSVSHAG